MGSDTMGRVVVAITVENLEDLFNADNGSLPREHVRKVEVPDALVDTGATGLLLPKRLIAALGLRPFRVRQARGLGGTVPLQTHSAARLTVQGRDCTLDVSEVPDNYPAIVGQVPLELLDWVVDPEGSASSATPNMAASTSWRSFDALP